MNLSELIQNLEVDRFKGNIETKIKNISSNSKEVSKDFLFVCLRGERFDGHNFIEEAIAKGAKAIVVEERIDAPSDISIIQVPDTRVALAQIAANFFGHPTQSIKVIGITGTNGKTTTAYMIESIFNKARIKIGRLSTISYQLGNREIKSSLTTPDPLTLQSYLRNMVEKKLDFCVMEVSSHALSQSRVEGIDFQNAIFTNITQDHLDFHGNFKAYLNSKIKLFKLLGNDKDKVAIINADDPHSQKIINETGSKIIKYGIYKDAYIKATNIGVDKEGYPFFNIGDIKIRLKIFGIHNIYNALAAITLSLLHNISIMDIKKGIERISQINGRLELVYNNEFKVFVDYAHTPDALQKILLSTKLLNPKRIITVFGCGGDRDKEKRPLMGKISSLLSDYTIITTDNPRHEDPLNIALEIKKGFRDEEEEKFEIILDRRLAISKAIKMAKRGDIILVAGKGHEDYQIFGDKKIYFKDQEVILEETSKIKKVFMDGADLYSQNSKDYQRSVKVG
jgi:UDP-N-acetylmuramoyl-L-alanyl-D-glutamate--2,6-diaminopimelate ligase